ncbi:MAG: cohesin domain-containing protein [Bacteroidetes bacterium]|nr:cohesin domain-containing protein [Bacteroidota bacterium]
MKKTVYTFCFLLIVLIQTVRAQNAPVSTIANVLMTATTVTVPITAANFTNIGSCNLKITYNPAIAIATNVTTGSGMGGNLTANLTVSGEITIGWYTYPGVTLSNNSIIFNISFQKVSSGTTALTFSDNGFSCIFYNGNSVALNDTPYAGYYQNGSLTVLQTTAPHTIAPVMTVISGNTVSVPIKVSAFSNIGSLALSLSYNPAVLTYITAINNSSFTSFSATSPVAGSLNISASTTAINGLTYPDSTVLFTLIFNSLGGTSSLNWIDNGSSCSYTGPLGSPGFTDTLQSQYYINGSVSTAATSIKGKFTYNNAANTAINGAIIQLVNSSNSIIATTTTAVYADYSIPANPVNVGGYYEFTNIISGNYTVRAIPSISWGGVNSTDALIIKKYTVGLITLSNLPLRAADVNKSNTVNSTDALLLQLRSIGTIGQFTLGDWVFGDSAVSVGGNATHDILLLAAGDVNQSYSFISKKEKQILNFEQQGGVYAAKQQEIEVAVSVNDVLNLGALSMEMLYDRNKIDILTLTSALKDIKYSISDGKIRIAWAELDAQQLHTDDILLSLKAKAKAEINNIRDVFSYSSTTEFADENGIPVDFNILKIGIMPAISNSSAIRIYPNPCNDRINIEYDVKEAGNVSLWLYNALGQRINIAETYNKAGSNKISFDTSILDAGIYWLEIKLNDTALLVKKISKIN